MASSLELLCKELNKKYKSEFIHKGVSQYSFDRIPFSSPKLNFMTYGGIPRGYIIEFSGTENGGKTTTALDICGQAQKLFKRENPDNPKKVLFIDAENTFNYGWAQKMGVDTDDLLIITPTDQYAESIFNDVAELVDTGEIGLAVLDSIAVLMTSAEFDEDFEKKQYGGVSIPLTKFSKKMTQLCKKNNCTFIGINQLRDNMNSMYGGTTTPGGRAWRHACILRLSFQHGRFIDEKNKEVSNGESNPFGNIVNVAVEKTKCCSPDRKGGHYTLRYDRGIDYISDLIDLCLAYGFVNQGGAWFSILDPDTGELLHMNDKDMKFQGQAKLYEELRVNPELRKYLFDKIEKYIKPEEPKIIEANDEDDDE